MLSTTPKSITSRSHRPGNPPENNYSRKRVRKLYPIGDRCGDIFGGFCCREETPVLSWQKDDNLRSGSACSKQPKRSGKGDRSVSIIHAELAIHMLGMQLDCSGCDHQFARNLPVCETLFEQVQDLQLALG